MARCLNEIAGMPQDHDSHRGAVSRIRPRASLPCTVDNSMSAAPMAKHVRAARRAVVSSKNASRLTTLAGTVSGAVAGATLQSWYAIAFGIIVGTLVGRSVARADDYVDAPQH